MPGVTAMAARWVPPTSKASTIASIYAAFNVGGVFGLAATPLLLSLQGWPAACVTAGALGSAVAFLCGAALPSMQPSSRAIPDQLTPSKPMPVTTVGAPPAAPPAPQQAHQGRWPPRGLMALQVAALCWSHAVIGWGFFIMQSWIPLYLASLRPGGSLGGTGLLSSLPWLAAALVGACVGGVSDGLLRRGTPRLRVRRAMHAVSTMGCAAAVLPLALTARPHPAVATSCLVLSLSCYAFSFGGFHAYLQDVAAGSGEAGTLQGVTNSCSIATGIAGNMAAGWLLAATGSYCSLFQLTVLLYASSFVVFCAVLRGQPVSLAALAANGTR